MKFYFILFVALKRAVSVSGELCLAVTTSSIRSRQRAVNLRSHCRAFGSHCQLLQNRKQYVLFASDCSRVLEQTVDILSICLNKRILCANSKQPFSGLQIK